MTMPVLLMGYLLSPTAILTAGGGTLAVHPLAVSEVSEKDEIQLGKLFNAEVQRLEKPVESKPVRDYLRTIPHRTCAGAPDLSACLAEMAKATGAKRALFLSIRLQPRIRLAGRVVREDGDVVVSTQRDFGRLAGSTRTSTLRRAIRQFLVADLSLGAPELMIPPKPISPTAEEKPVASVERPQKPEPSPETTVPPTPPAQASETPPVRIRPKLEPPPPRPPEVPAVTAAEPESGSGWMRPMGYTALGAGGAAGGLGVFFLLRSSSGWKDFNSHTGYLTPDDVQRLNSLKSKAERERTAGTVLLISGGVLLTSGITLLILDHNRRSSGASVRLVPQLRGIALAGTLP